MPSLQEKIEKGMLFRICCYGPAKSRKTWWALRAAELGFNTFLFDCDDGAHIGIQLPEEARRNVQVLDAVDQLNRPIAAQFIIHLLKGLPFLWDADDKQKVEYAGMFNPEHEHYYIDATKLTSNDVFILDSWTSLCYSIAWRYSVENNIDLTDFDKPEWDGYAFCGRLANWILSQLKALPCHVIMIGHSTVYEKYKGTSRNRKLDWQRTQMVSVSGPHAGQVPKNFSDILRYTFNGIVPMISVQSERDADAGSRIVPPGNYTWDELQLSNIAQMGAIPLPGGEEPSQGIINYAPGSDVDLSFLQSGGITSLISQPAQQATIPAAANKGFAALLEPIGTAKES